MPGGESDILGQVRDAVIAGDLSAIEGLTQRALGEGIEAARVMEGGLVPAMDVVGERFEAKEYFVPEVLVSARTMQASLALLKPLLEERDIRPLGTVAIGTVKGDLHDIGKNIVAMVLTGAGFEVENLGADVPPLRFVEAAERGVQIIGLSSLLTTTRDVMGEVTRELERRGLRADVKVIIGGAAVTAKFAGEIGADRFGADATDAVRQVKDLLGVR